MPNHRQILSAEDAEVWQRFQDTMRRNSICGLRIAAVHTIAQETAADEPELAERINDIRARLAIAGVLKSFRFGIHFDPEREAGQRWTIGRIHEGSKNAGDFWRTHRPQQSQRFALNDAYARNIAEAYAADAAAICDQIDAAVEACNRRTPDIETFADLAARDGLRIAVVTTQPPRPAEYRIFLSIPDVRYHDGMSGTYAMLTVGQAAWISAKIRSLIA